MFRGTRGACSSQTTTIHAFVIAYALEIKNSQHTRPIEVEDHVSSMLAMQINLPLLSICFLVSQKTTPMLRNGLTVPLPSKQKDEGPFRC